MQQFQTIYPEIDFTYGTFSMTDNNRVAQFNG